MSNKNETIGKNLTEASSLILWQSYCDKKAECEMLSERLTFIVNQREELIGFISNLIDNSEINYEAKDNAVALLYRMRNQNDKSN